MTYVSNLDAVLNALEDSIGSGLAAAADMVADKVSRKLAPGFTDGSFKGETPGEAAEESVQVQVFMHEAENPFARIWSDKKYLFYWEVGHWNIYPRKFVRKEIWVPTLYGTANEQVLRFTAAAQRTWSARGG